MKSIIQIALILVATIFSFPNLSAQDCDVPKHIQDVTTVKLEFDKTTIKSGAQEVITGYFKTPGNSSHVLAESDWVKCEGFMPGGARMTGTEMLGLSGLPNGLEWSLNNSNGKYGSGETGCLTISGNTTIKGDFPIVIKMKGTGSILGFKRTYECVIDKFQITVE